MGYTIQDSRRISIHALREEGDYCTACLKVVRKKFLSTPSARRATHYPQLPPHHRKISIHALREEGDRRRKCKTHIPVDFYPRPPRGGRPDTENKNEWNSIFLSTPSARRATVCHFVRPLSC